MDKKRISVFITVFVLTSLFLCFPAFAATGGGFWAGFRSFFSDMLDGIGTFIANAVKHLLDGIQWLFVPKQGVFDSFMTDISVRFNAKFGAITAAFDYLGGRFKNLREYNDLAGVFKVTFPKSSFLSGLSVNFLSVAAPVLGFIRFAITGFCCYVTAMICYHKGISMVSK